MTNESRIYRFKNWSLGFGHWSFLLDLTTLQFSWVLLLTCSAVAPGYPLGAARKASSAARVRTQLILRALQVLATVPALRGPYLCLPAICEPIIHLKVLRITPVLRAATAFGLVLFTVTSGCGRLVYKPSNPNAGTAQQQMQVVAQQNHEYQSRAQSLDKDNQELESLLAQSRQQIQLLTDEVNATRDQLRTTTDQLLAMREDNSQLQTKTSALVASAQQRASGEIRANNSLLKNITLDHIPGVSVRQDGDVVRVEVPSDQIFMPGSPYLKNGAEQLLHGVATDLRRNFPTNIIGIEGHTDDSQTHSQQYPSNHHLSAAQALSAYNALVDRNILPAQQVFVMGHGSNHPIVSNATDSGKARNRRLELVVYPERIASR